MAGLFGYGFTASTDLSKIAENGLRQLMCPSLETGNPLDGALSEDLRKGCGWVSVMVVREKCDEKSMGRQFGKPLLEKPEKWRTPAWSVGAVTPKERLDSRRSWNPTLRKVREGWGTPCVAGADGIKASAYSFCTCMSSQCCPNVTLNDMYSGATSAAPIRTSNLKTSEGAEDSAILNGTRLDAEFI